MKINKKLLILPLLFPLIVQAQETIVWTKYDLPPLYIKEGPEKNNGIVDTHMAILSKKLSEYKHEYTFATVARVKKELTQQQPNITTCTSWLKNAEREEIAYFSRPSRVLPTHKIITLKKHEDKFLPLLESDGKTLSLENTLSNSDLFLGISRDRSYGVNRNDAIAEKKNIYTRSGSRDSSGLFDMLLTDRLDFIIEYPWLIAYELKVGKKAELTSYNIQEKHKDSFGYFSCTKSPTGEKIIAKINDILKDELPKDSFREISEKWIPAELLADYRKDYSRVLTKE